MQISPLQALPVAYETSIPGDTTLYYVQAVLRDTASSAVLQALNLKNVSSTPNRYVGSFNGSNLTDASGLGHAVDVTITVYTDSGYSVLSPNYQILQTSYMVLQPWINNLGMGGGLNIDYDKLQKMFDGKKMDNAEIGNELSRRIPKFDYSKISEATETSRSALSAELRGHVEALSKAFADAQVSSTSAYTAHNARFDALERRIQAFEGTMQRSSTLSSKERSQVKSELSKALKELREETRKSFAEGNRRNGESLQKVSDELRDYLQETMSEKEIKINYAPASYKKGKEKPEPVSDEYLRLLR